MGSYIAHVNVDQDRDQGQWVHLQDIGPSARTGAKLAYDPGGNVTLLFGGSTDAGTWAWDGANWKEVADMGPGARQGHTLSTSDGGVILFGGAAPAAREAARSPSRAATPGPGLINRGGRSRTSAQRRAGAMRWIRPARSSPSVAKLQQGRSRATPGNLRRTAEDCL